MTRCITQLLAALLLLPVLSCEKQESRSYAERQQASVYLDSLISSHYLARKFSGAVLVAKQGELILSKEYGYQTLDSAKKIDRNSVFEIASLSKQFTAMMVMLTKLAGLLDYDDPIERHLTEFPYRGITIRHLLTHTSGLSERAFFQWAGRNMDVDKFYTNEIVLKYLKSEKPALAFSPGEKWEYSNVGYFLLASILEKVNGKHYISLLQEKILTPLDMQNTGIYSQGHKGSRMENYAFSKVFSPNDSGYISAFGLAWSDSMYGGVGIVSNASDLYKWDRALQQNTLIDAATWEEAIIAYMLPDNMSSQYGFGWFVRDSVMINDKNLGKRIDHYGVWPGYESSIVRYLDPDLTIIIIANQSPSTKNELIDHISEIILDK